MTIPKFYFDVCSWAVALCDAQEFVNGGGCDGADLVGRSVEQHQVRHHIMQSKDGKIDIWYDSNGFFLFSPVGGE